MSRYAVCAFGLGRSLQILGVDRSTGLDLTVLSPRKNRAGSTFAAGLLFFFSAGAVRR